MKKLSTSIAMAMALTLFALPSCKKFIDPHPEDPDEIGKYCRIDTLDVQYYLGGKVKVSYNPAGNPISMIATNGPINDLHFDNIFFKYDKHDRLIDYSIVFPGVSFPDFEQRFSYPQPRLIVDSFFNSEFPNVIRVLYYSLDEKDRIIKTLIKDYQTPGQPDITIYTSYDKKGNKIIPGVVYDDKINIYRTNKVWQLVYGDYSMNNPIAPATGGYPASIVSYNEVGLPVQYQSVPAQPQFNLFFYIFDSMKVTYSCSLPSGHDY